MKPNIKQGVEFQVPSNYYEKESTKKIIFISRGCAGGNTESSIMGKSMVWNISEWPTMPKLHNNQFRHIKNTLKQHSIWFQKLRTSFNTWQKIETGGHLREFEEGENLKSLEKN